MSTFSSTKKDIWSQFIEGSEPPAGWIRKTKGDMYLDTRTGNPTKPVQAEKYDVYVRGVGLVNHAGNKPSQAIKPYFKAIYDYESFLEDERTIAKLKVIHPTIANGSKTDFTEELTEWRTKRDSVNPYGANKGNMTLNEIADNRKLYYEYRDRVNAMVAKEKGLFGTISDQAFAEEEHKAVTSESVAQVKEKLSKKERGQ